MITHSFYENDNRVMRYAESLAERGDCVEVVALRRGVEYPTEEVICGVKVFRIQRRFDKRGQSSASYLWPLLRFLAASSWWLTRRHGKQRFDLVHVHNIPDFLVFAAWYPKLMGAKVILDIHDIVPEFYASKFAARGNSFLVGLLKRVEWASAKFANHVIISNHLWRDKYAARTRTNGKCSVFINNVDSQTFRPRPRTRNDGKLVILFPGGLQWHQGLDIAIRAFQTARPQLSNAEFHIYGEGKMKESLMALAKELGLDGSVRFFKPLPLRQVSDIMANADLGVVPKRADSFGNEAYSTKIMEFMSLGVPIAVSSTEVDRYYFNDSVVRFFESGNSDSLAEAMVEVLGDAGLRQRLVANAFEYVSQNSWESRKADYLHLVDSMIAGSAGE